MMNYHFILREDEGSGYRIDCRFNRAAAIDFAADMVNLVDGATQALFEAHEGEGHGMFSVGSVGKLTLVAVRD